MSENTAQKACNCGYPAKWAADPNSPIIFDETLKEYRVLLKDSRSCHIMRYCIFCGGKLPKSKRQELFSVLDKGEVDCVNAELAGAKSIADVYHRLGKPDAIEPVCQSDYSQQLRYSSRWTSLDLIVIERLDGTIEYLCGGKYIGPALTELDESRTQGE
jgi:hypothetical protein